MLRNFLLISVFPLASCFVTPPLVAHKPILKPFTARLSTDFTRFSPRSSPDSSIMLLRSSDGGPNGSKGQDTDIFLPVAWLGSSTRFLVSISALSLVLVERSSTSLAFVMSAVVNSILGKVLKQVINQSRPEGSPLSEKAGGMPSSHGVALGYLYAGACVIFLDGNFLCLPSLALLAYASVGLYYRVLRRLHTPEQVVAGFGFGAVNAAVVWGFTTLGEGLVEVVERIVGPVSWEAAVALGIVGALTVGWREVKQGRRFVIGAKKAKKKE